MLSIHFNGDIVSHPDYNEVHKKAQEIRDLHRICIYNYHEVSCLPWLIKVKTGKHSGRCDLAGCADCPGHKRRLETGNKGKHYKIDHATYRKMSSSVHYLLKASKDIAIEKFNVKCSKLKRLTKKDGTPTKAYLKAQSKTRVKAIFITLTFPRFRKKHRLTKTIFENETLNIYFSKFMENLRKNYSCVGYVAVREHGENNTLRTHYHVCLAIPFIDLRTLNTVWSNTIQTICFPSRNCLQSDKKTRVIYDTIGAVRYMCKYFSKSRGAESNSRLVFISHNLIKTAEKYTGKIEDILDGYDSVTYYETSDYTATFRIIDPKEFKEFCMLFLYELYGLTGETLDLSVRSP